MSSKFHRAAAIASLILLLPACKDTRKIDEAMEALKAREEKINVREVLSQERDLMLTNKEKELAETQASLARQFQEIETAKANLQKEIAEAKRQKQLHEEIAKRGTPPRVNADRYMVIDPKSGDILFEHNADKRGQVASTQKLMTALIIAEAGDLDLPVTIEESDTQCAPVRFGLKAGEQYSRRQLLTALMVKSSNDIAQALARDNAGSIEAFAKKMNLRAAELGMKNSHFVNPNGLPNDDQYSTPRDMAKVAKAIDVNADVREMVKTKTYSITKGNGKVEILKNTNRVLHGFAYCDGMKTGYTQLAGFCLIASGEKAGQRRIVLVFNDTSTSVWRDAQALLEWGLPKSA